MKVTHNAPPGSKKRAKARPAAKPVAKAKTKGAASRGLVRGLPSSTEDIAESAGLMQKATDLAHQAPDVRKDKVAALKKKVQSGSYRVDAAAVADKLVDEHASTDLGKNKV